MVARRGGRKRVWVWVIVLISVLLPIGLPILGFDASLRLLGVGRNATAGHWRSLGTPPELPAAIEDADLNQVYVRGRDGSLFECRHNGTTQNDACWEEVEQVRDRDSDVEHRDTFQGERPPPPGPVAESLDVSWEFAERASRMRYVLLEDGSVWVWTHHADANTSLGVLFGGPVCGLILAIAIVLLIWLTFGVWVLLQRRKGSQ